VHFGKDLRVVAQHPAEVHPGDHMQDLHGLKGVMPARQCSRDADPGCSHARPG
jgi:hypothetical protein